MLMAGWQKMFFLQKNLVDSEKSLTFANEKVKEGDNGIPTERKSGFFLFCRPSETNTKNRKIWHICHRRAMTNS